MTTNIRAKRIDVRAVRQALDTVARRDPYRKDRRVKDGLPARYIDQGQPNCLVAAVLVELGFPTTLLRDLDRERPVGALFSAGVDIAESNHPALKRIDPVARQLLQYCQRRQDSGYLWQYIAEEAFQGNGWLTTKWNLRKKPWLAQA